MSGFYRTSSDLEAKLVLPIIYLHPSKNHLSPIMYDERYATTHRLVKKKPASFESYVGGITTLLKTPYSDKKIAEGGLRLQGFFKESCEAKPLITVVTVVYNDKEFIEETIKSVIEQTYDNVEYIIVDGGSVDGTLDIIREYQHAIDYWVSEPDKGIYDAMNKGIDLGGGDWVNFMNSGDFFYEKETLSRVLEYSSQYNKISVIYGNHQVRYPTKKKLFKAGRAAELWKGSQFCHQSTLIDLRCHKEKKYSLRYKMAADFNFFWENRKVFEFCYRPIPISSISNGGVSDLDRLSVYKEFSSICSNKYSFVFFKCQELLFRMKRLFKQ